MTTRQARSRGCTPNTEFLLFTLLFNALFLGGRSWTSVAYTRHRRTIKRVTASLAGYENNSSSDYFGVQADQTVESTVDSLRSTIDKLADIGRAVKNGATDTMASEKNSLEYVSECDLPTKHGVFRLRGYRWGDWEPTVIIAGDVAGADCLLRVHDQCFTSEVLGSQRCDCKEQLEMALAQIMNVGRGAIVYLPQEGRGIGLANKIAAYGLQDQGMDTVEANVHLGFPEEARVYDIVAPLLRDLRITSIRLLTNNPFKISSLENLGITINERLPLLISPNKDNKAYLSTKALRMNHILPSSLAPLIAPSVSSPEASEAAAPTLDIDDDDASETFVNPISGRIHSWCMGKESVERTIEAIQRGELVVVTDDADRENEGDLIMAGELATPEALGFMIRYTSGVICVALEADQIERLKLPPMVVNNEDPKETAFTVSVDSSSPGMSTGISAADRATTLRMLASSTVSPDEFSRPGHIFPLKYAEGGVLKRGGHTEASVDLCKAAGLSSAGVLCEIVSADCIEMARMPELLTFAKTHRLEMTTIEDLACYRILTESKEES